MTRRFAVLSVDLDTPARGTGSVPSPEQFEYVVSGAYANTLPRLLALLEKLSVSAVFYVVARDLRDPARAKIIADAARRGHEIGNHSLSHDRMLASAPEDVFSTDLMESTAVIAAVAGTRPVSYRMPGAVLRPGPLAALSRAGYRCDSSLNAAPLYNAAKRLRSIFGNEDAAPVQEFAARRAPAEPYRPLAGDVFAADCDGDGIIEYPLTPMFCSGLPFMNYFLSRMPERPAMFLARRACANRSFVTLTAHDHEFAAPEDFCGALPGGMASRHALMPLDERLRRFSALIEMMKADFDFTTPSAHSVLAAGSGGL